MAVTQGTLLQVLGLAWLLQLGSGRKLQSASFLGTQRLEQPPAPPAAGLSYAQHGIDWQDGSCASRMSQSPVSLDTSLKEPPQGYFDYYYEHISDPSLKLLANRSMLTLDLAGAMGASGGPIGGIRYNKALYQLQRVDIKGPSEHMLAGERYALELQLVHREVGVHNPGGWVIVSALVWSEKPPAPPDPNVPPPPFAPPGAAEVDFNANLQCLVTEEPPSAEGASGPLVVTPQAPLDLGLLFENRQIPPADRKVSPFMMYSGSLTAPPCEEKATWFVRREPVFMSQSQVNVLANSLFTLTANQGSYRDLMPLNKRRPTPIAPSFAADIAPALAAASFSSSGAPGASPPMPPGPGLPWGPNPRTDKEYGAAMTSKVAREDAQHTAEYAKNLAMKLAAGEKAYADEMHPPPGATTPKPSTTLLPGLQPAVEQAVGTLAVRGDPVVMEKAKVAAAEHTAHALQSMAGVLRGESARQSTIAGQMLG